MKNNFPVFCFVFLAAVSGQTQNFSEREKVKSKILVIVFLSLDCPISQNYIAELNRITDKYSMLISLMGIIPGKVKKKDLRFFITEYEVRFPVKTDKNYELVKKLNAKTTPEVFVYSKTGTLQYSGAIDDWYYELGKHRQQVSKYYLKDAIEAILSGREPSEKQTHAIGCSIQIF